MLIFGRALSRQRSVPRMWQARMRIEKSTGWWHASERPKPSSTKRANDSRLLRGSSSGSDDFSAVEKEGFGLSEACRSEEHTSELQSPDHIVCRLLLEKKKKIRNDINVLIYGQGCLCTFISP